MYLDDANEIFGFAAGMMANLEEMPAPKAGSTPPQSGLLKTLSTLFNMLNSDVSAQTWKMLHPKCTDFVSRVAGIEFC